MNLVIVESPSKAKTIEKYLGKDFKVIASYGHIRDIPSKANAVDIENDFNILWDSGPENKKHIKSILSAAQKTDSVYLATDPDREGEAISWHIYNILKDNMDINNKIVKRVIFHEITKKAILKAMDNPKDLNDDLIDAYLARRVLDYLVGFNLSPMLWRRIPGSKSAGRVQSVALRLLVERELLIKDFISQKYWSIECLLDDDICAYLSHYQNKLLGKMEIDSKEKCDKIFDQLNIYKDWKIDNVESKKISKNPYAPFTTSTLQQEASSKLFFGVRKTMQIAQKLYEGIKIDGSQTGLITYMRTDSTNMSKDAIDVSRNIIENEFGDKYLPKSPNIFKTKVKNAQEAHEAIRPTDFHKKPDQIKSQLSDDEFKLYNLIWKRALASQMEKSQTESVSAFIIPKESNPNGIILKSQTSVLLFDGFLKVYKKDEEEAKKTIKRRLCKDDLLKLTKAEKIEHETKPPPRYNEASLVKELESLGIGRPSTYASIITVLQYRNYVKISSRKFYVEMLGFFVTCFLKEYFKNYVEYDFTATMEQKLDDISSGNIEWKKVIKEFWKTFKLTIDNSKEIRITNVIDLINDKLKKYFLEEYKDKDKEQYPCPKCKKDLIIKFGKFSGFLSCSGYPDCDFTSAINTNETKDNTAEEIKKNQFEPIKITEDILIKKGPYGFYIEKINNEKSKKRQITSMPKDMAKEDITKEIAEKLISFPKDIGAIGDDPVTAGIGRYGPYLLYLKKYYKVESTQKLLVIDIMEAKNIINKAKTVEKKAKK